MKIVDDRPRVGQPKIGSPESGVKSATRPIENWANIRVAFGHRKVVDGTAGGVENGGWGQIGSFNKLSDFGKKIKGVFVRS